MSALHEETIAAISSAVGPAARMIVRVSGTGARAIADKVIAPHPPESSDGGATTASARRQRVRIAGLAIPAWIYSFISPRSYTGQDLIEFHLPGNPLLCQMLLNECLARGARLAEPGEFTARAFFNGRMDLSQAEGVAAAIAATGQKHLDAARRLLAGELSRRLRPAMDALIQTISLVEAGIDFAEEEISFLSSDQIQSSLSRIDEILDQLARESSRFGTLSHLPMAAIIGRPNAGKSTLLNALCGSRRAVVSSMAGTTRDLLSAPMMTRRGMIELIDTAGLESERAEDGGEIARQMRQRALSAIESADILVAVREVGDRRKTVEISRIPDLTVLTKIDLHCEDAARLASENETAGVRICISAVTGRNMNALCEAIDVLAFGDDSPEPTLALNARHLQAIGQARELLQSASLHVRDQALELIAADLRGALDELGQILGVVSPDEILGKIFSSFCIGK